MFAENFLLFSGIVLLKGTFQLFFLLVLSVHRSYIGFFFYLLLVLNEIQVFKE